MRPSQNFANIADATVDGDVTGGGSSAYQQVETNLIVLEDKAQSGGVSSPEVHERVPPPEPAEPREALAGLPLQLAKQGHQTPEAVSSRLRRMGRR